MKYKLITWNKGPAFAIHKIPEIHQILLEQKPTILAIQEFNIRDIDDIQDLQFPQYSLEIDTMRIKYGWSRSATYIHESTKYSRRLDLEEKYESMVAVTLHPTRNKPINIINYYRQWQICTPQGAVINTGSVNHQVNRMRKIANKIQASQNTNTTITLSDTNLDFNIDWSHPSKMSAANRKYYPLYTLFREEIFNHNIFHDKNCPNKTLHQFTRYHH